MLNSIDLIEFQQRSFQKNTLHQLTCNQIGFVADGSLIDLFTCQRKSINENTLFLTIYLSALLPNRQQSTRIPNECSVYLLFGHIALLDRLNIK